MRWLVQCPTDHLHASVTQSAACLAYAQLHIGKSNHAVTSIACALAINVLVMPKLHAHLYIQIVLFVTCILHLCSSTMHN